MPTKILILSSVAIWLIYNMYAIPMGQPTESMAIRDWMLKYCWVSYACGVVFGHWIFPAKTRRWWMRGDLLVPGITILAMLGFDLAWIYLGPNEFVWFRYPGIWAMVGIPVGALWWSQSR